MKVDQGTVIYIIVYGLVTGFFGFFFRLFWDKLNGKGKAEKEQNPDSDNGQASKGFVWKCIKQQQKNCTEDFVRKDVLNSKLETMHTEIEGIPDKLKILILEHKAGDN